MTGSEHVEEVEVELVGGRIDPMALELGRHYRLIVKRPRLQRVELGPLRHRPRSAVLVPSAHNDGAHPLAAVLTALGRMGDEPELELVVIGHSHPDEPDALARDRADALVALLQGERERWVQIATRSGALTDVIEYVNYLGHERGWPCWAGEPAPEPTVASATGVEAFQHEYNRRFQASIDEDGVCGVQTLGAIFDVLRHELERWMLKHELGPESIRLHATVPSLAAGSRTATSARLRRPDTDDYRRIVDLVLVGPDSLHGAAPSVELLYQDERTSYAVLPVEPEPGAWEFGEVVVFLPEDDPLRPTLRYELRSAAGDFHRTLSAAEDGLVVEGFVELTFDGVPTAGVLTMLAHAGPDTTVLFEDVPYADIEDLPPLRDEDILAPHLVPSGTRTEA